MSDFSNLDPKMVYAAIKHQDFVKNLDSDEKKLFSRLSQGMESISLMLN